ncbi:Nn.00g032780.m01.CDS01 [Neocucurbitaria sp. VM-36]
MATEGAAGDGRKHSMLDSSFPVLLPEDAALFMPEGEFQAFVKQLIAHARHPDLKELEQEIATIHSDSTATSESKTVSGHILKRKASTKVDNLRLQKAPFVEGLEKHAAHHRTVDDLAADNKTLTENLDVTNISSKDPIVDLFYDLGEFTKGDELKVLLDEAWSEDPILTLKVIFNARSIHLGKSNRVASYKAFGWLAEYHPLTLLANLRWLVRPVIEKNPTKAEEKRKSEEGDFAMIDAEESDPAKAYDVRYGVSHGYWKDLLNLVVFAANDQLKFDGDPTAILNQKTDDSPKGKRKRNWDQATAKELRQKKKREQSERVQDKMKNDPFYRALHISVARLFAEQLREDKVLLTSGKKSDLKKISLAAKWAPTFGEFHDKHTFIQSTIAEILFPEPASYCPDASNRELYLRHIREHYRKEYASPLRKALAVVERDIAAETFDNIKYDRVPSLAMDRYTSLFMKKDWEHFKDYVQDVAKGTAKISGATLLPSTLVSKAKGVHDLVDSANAKDFKAVKAAAESKIQAEIIDGQWNTLVKRVRDAGTLQSSIAVCDVSGSMSTPRFKDGSCPMDSAIGLSLLIAEVTAAPFGGGFISFHETPTYLSIGGSDSDPRGLVAKVRYITKTPWGYNTNFVSVFEDVLLPMAIANKLKQEDMVKQIFVFSDMQFDHAEHDSERWTSSYDRIKQKYADAGYEVPRLIFWNLAALSKGKPVIMDDVDTALVSGYSQGMLRAFLESGAFDDDEEEVVEEDIESGGEYSDGEGMMDVRNVKKKITPITVVKKAVGNKAYGMLEVVD